MHSTVSGHGPPAIDVPPESIDDAPLTIDAAAALMARYGFVAFRTPPGSSIPDSCLMAVLRQKPTLEHFDPEVVSYWTFNEGHGRLATVEATSPMPISRAVSWGRVDISDRLHVHNSFVTFGGHVSAEPVGPDAVLVIFRSSAPILRLSGHSQRQDALAQEAVGFFARLLPHLWDSPAIEQRLGRTPPDALWAAFLLHERDRLGGSIGSAGEISEADHRVLRSLRGHASERPGAVATGSRLLEDLGLRTPR